MFTVIQAIKEEPANQKCVPEQSAKENVWN
jgi:hypothetical protein